MSVGEELSQLEDEETREEMRKERQEERERKKEEQRRIRKERIEKSVSKRKREYKEKLENNNGVISGGKSNLVKFLSYGKGIGIVENIEDDLEELFNERRIVNIRVGNDNEGFTEYKVIQTPYEKDISNLVEEYVYLEDGSIEKFLESVKRDKDYGEVVVKEKYKVGSVMERKTIRQFWFDVIDETLLKN